ncbi:Ketopantoate reductase ApbA/PanE [Penicillium coprophilum]|uniref:Ketopantoate reductase ApbA/PanE n=1 Tax=Penicillium coprophilum TaxID=36646 RepID=UPI0023A15949|nr:Ketopantoate reductase ApbA/PanE [Penicillium coprophilum]KAJ5158033.1 Ketopantoate reductase ApbA/PanE [Penicillium coprophilum]
MSSISLAKSVPRFRVHIIGLGSIGTFAAHAVSEIPNGPSVTLLLHRRSLLETYCQNGNQIRFESTDGKHLVSRGYDLETIYNDQWHLTTPPSPDSPVGRDEIQHLIVCTKATQTVSALRPLVPRLNRASNILFLQNGSGVIEEVNKHLFPDPSSRPNYLIGVISHGVTLNSPFNITHTGVSATSIGPVPSYPSANVDIPDSQSSYLRQTLPDSPILSLTSYSYTDILQIQLEKLAVNAFCNPICALNDAQNKFLFSVPETRRAILTEISEVVLSLGELQGVPGLKERFSVDRLEQTVHAIIEKTANTTCSMVWDLRSRRETEISFINGSWSQMGRAVGVATPVNDELVEKILKIQGSSRQI